MCSDKLVKSDCTSSMFYHAQCTQLSIYINSFTSLTQFCIQVGLALFPGLHAVVALPPGFRERKRPGKQATFPGAMKYCECTLQRHRQKSKLCSYYRDKNFCITCLSTFWHASFTSWMPFICNLRKHTCRWWSHWLLKRGVCRSAWIMIFYIQKF